MTPEERVEREALTGRLAEAGYDFLYGGGAESKGHGFWLMKDARPFCNDGTETGNPHFWTCAQCERLLSLQEREANPSEIFDGGKRRAYADALAILRDHFGTSNAARAPMREIERLIKLAEARP